MSISDKSNRRVAASSTWFSCCCGQLNHVGMPKRNVAMRGATTTAKKRGTSTRWKSRPLCRPKRRCAPASCQKAEFPGNPPKTPLKICKKCFAWHSPCVLNSVRVGRFSPTREPRTERRICRLHLMKVRGAFILDAFNKTVRDGFVVEKSKPTGKVITPRGDEIPVQEFAGVRKGSAVFVKNDIVSLV